MLQNVVNSGLRTGVCAALTNAKSSSHAQSDCSNVPLPVCPPPRARPFSGDELPMPAQQGVGSHDRGDVAQDAAAQPIGQRGQPSSIDVGQNRGEGFSFA
jgi:hypothetical protein